VLLPGFSMVPTLLSWFSVFCLFCCLLLLHRSSHSIPKQSITTTTAITMTTTTTTTTIIEGFLLCMHTPRFCPYVFCIPFDIPHSTISPVVWLYIHWGVPLLLHHSEHHFNARCITALYLTIGISYYLIELIMYLETTCSFNCCCQFQRSVITSVHALPLEVFHTYLHQKPVSIATSFSWMSLVPSVIASCVAYFAVTKFSFKIWPILNVHSHGTTLAALQM